MISKVEGYVLIAIGVVLAVLILISIISRRMDLLLNFILRIVAGAVGIYFLNSILTYTPVTGIVGINGTTILTIGLLGAPGFLLVYAVAIYFGMFK